MMLSVPKDWTETTLGEFTTLQRGVDLPAERRIPGDTPVMGSFGITGWHNLSNVEGPGVTVGRSGASFGVVTYSPDNFWAHNTCLYVKDFNANHPRFAFYLLKSINFKPYNSGTAQGSLNRNFIHPMKVWVPPLPEQQAIAHILGSLDDKIELNRRMNKTLESIARAIFKSWFIDFEPIPGLGPHKEWEDSVLGKIPKGWNVIPLTDAIDFKEGPGLRNWQYAPDGMKFLNIRCIVDGDLDIAKANCISFDEFNTRYRDFALTEDDIVISTSGTLGRLAILRSDHLPVMLNTSIIRMRSKAPYNLSFLWNFLQSEYFLLEMFALASGSVQLNFGPIHLNKMKCLMPSQNNLELFENITQPLLRKVSANRVESKTLSTIRDTLLPKLLSGEIRIKDAEKIVSQAV